MNRTHFRQRPIVLALASTLALASGQAIAQDVEIRTPAAGNAASPASALLRTVRRS